MKIFRRSRSWTIIVVFLVTSIGCAQHDDSGEAPKALPGFRALDTNQDKKIDAQEFKKLELLRRLDANRSGGLSWEEFKGLETLTGPLADFDANKNGEIGREEFDKLEDAVFKKLDADNDQKLDELEYAQLQKTLDSMTPRASREPTRTDR